MNHLQRMAIVAAIAAINLGAPIIESDPAPRRLPLDPLPPREHFESERPISKRRKRRLRGKARTHSGDPM